MVTQRDLAELVQVGKNSSLEIGSTNKRTFLLLTERLKKTAVISLKTFNDFSKNTLGLKRSFPEFLFRSK